MNKVPQKKCFTKKKLNKNIRLEKKRELVLFEVYKIHPCPFFWMIMVIIFRTMSGYFAGILSLINERA